MKALFICLTDYQMLNALNIKTHLLKDKEADILFFDNKAGHRQLAQRLQNLGIFQNVYLHQYTNVYGLHKYLRAKTDKNRESIGLLKAFGNSIKELIYKAGVKILGKKYKINAKLYGDKKINFGEYSQVFGIVTKDVVKDTMQLILEKNPNTEINFIEDGTFTYWRRSIKTDLPLDNIFLYQPELANYYNEGYQNKIKQIPAIDWQDEAFRKVLNEVFAFTNSNADYSDKVIFFDQNWDPMPEYLKNLTGVKKIILRNPYKKHLKESQKYNKKMELFRILADNFAGIKDVIVKLHPRSSDSFVQDYQQSVCKIAENLKVPWEVFEDNYTFKNNIWVTVSSTALCSLLMAFKNKHDNVKLVFLYKLVYEDGAKYKEDNEFFERFRDRYEGKVYIPNNIDEYMKYIKNN